MEFRHDVDPRVATALSGDFQPTCDPSSGTHNLSFLVMATAEKGSPVEGDPKGAISYLPPWAPVVSTVNSSDEFSVLSKDLGVTSAALLIKHLRGLDHGCFHVELIDPDGVGIIEKDLSVDTVAECASSRKEMTQLTRSFFSRFVDWEFDEEAKVWLPRSATSSGPAPASC